MGYRSLHAPATSQFQWRFPLAVQAVPALLLGIGMFFVAESPRFLIEKKHHTEAQDILRKLHFDGTNAEWIDAEYAGICTALDGERHVTAPGWISMFKVTQWRTRLLSVQLYHHPRLGSKLTFFTCTASPSRSSPRWLVSL